MKPHAIISQPSPVYLQILFKPDPRCLNTWQIKTVGAWAYEAAILFFIVKIFSGLKFNSSFNLFEIFSWFLFA